MQPPKFGRLGSSFIFEPAPNQTEKKLIFVRMPIFKTEKCRQIHVFPNHIKVTLIDIFSNALDIFEEN